MMPTRSQSFSTVSRICEEKEWFRFCSISAMPLQKNVNAMQKKAAKKENKGQHFYACQRVNLFEKDILNDRNSA